MERLNIRRFYPGTDLVYYGKQGRLEFDFIVAPGADPKEIRLHFDASGPLSIAKDGAVRVATREGPSVALRIWWYSRRTCSKAISGQTEPTPSDLIFNFFESSILAGILLWRHKRESLAICPDEARRRYLIECVGP
jgi:hypothetical protein